MPYPGNKNIIYLYNKQRLKDWIPLIQSLICLVFAIIFHSRSFTIGYLMSTFFIGWSLRRFAIRKGMVLTLIFIFLLLVFFLASNFKTDSSFGRMLIYKICFRILEQNFFSGIGWGNFGVVYARYQAGYFREGSYTTKELLLADNTKHAFNDYLEFVTETGLAGLIALLATALLIFLFIKKAFKNKPPYAIPLTIATSQLIAISVAALFTFVFKKFFFQCMLVSALLVIFFYQAPSKKSLYNCLLAAIFFLTGITWFHTGSYMVNYDHYKRYREAKDLFRAGYLAESLKIYEGQYPDLKEDQLFLSDYANALVSSGHYTEAIKILEKLISIDSGGMLYEELADCYFRTGQWGKAENAYLTLIYMVPNRFTSRFYLFNFYDQTKQAAKAITTGRSILSLPVKVPSTQVSYIKETVQARLQQLEP